MAQLTTDTTIKGHGLRFDVRSYKLFRSIDFSLADLKGDATEDETTVSTYYEIGDLPPGFVPRNVALVELVKPPVAQGETGPKVGVYLKSDSAKLVERTLGTAAGVTVGQVTGKNLAGAGDTLCLTVDAPPARGRVKVVISGDLMTDVWDEGDKTEEITPASTVLTNMIG